MTDIRDVDSGAYRKSLQVEIDSAIDKAHLACQVLLKRARTNRRLALLTAALWGLGAGILIGASSTRWASHDAILALSDDVRVLTDMHLQSRAIDRLAHTPKIEVQVAELRKKQGLAPMPPWQKGHRE